MCEYDASYWDDGYYCDSNEPTSGDNSGSNSQPGYYDSEGETFNEPDDYDYEGDNINENTYHYQADTLGREANPDDIMRQLEAEEDSRICAAMKIVEDATGAVARAGAGLADKCKSALRSILLGAQQKLAEVAAGAAQSAARVAKRCMSALGSFLWDLLRDLAEVAASAALSAARGAKEHMARLGSILWDRLQGLGSREYRGWYLSTLWSWLYGMVRGRPNAPFQCVCASGPAHWPLRMRARCRERSPRAPPQCQHAGCKMRHMAC
jgi:hypothetical protein